MAKTHIAIVRHIAHADAAYAAQATAIHITRIATADSPFAYFGRNFPPRGRAPKFGLYSPPRLALPRPPLSRGGGRSAPAAKINAVPTAAKTTRAIMSAINPISA